jgi:hypothetical protein
MSEHLLAVRANVHPKVYEESTTNRCCAAAIVAMRRPNHLI